ncbi:Gfo/Idh/MocA family protein [Amycolatopsis thermophila]|uniref:Dehydrogenase n=1 Tax=Amycolatopsis thermophila TaxID=206084 RepID=A0ABU0F3D8_9PSEU|nr:Gfo/Idh/MocA family oxidoreductase [Amycolatopsis thermophila]MDQ0381547.1 putative dehydrogenase [Amycolatopsis thermophila]
MIKDSGLRVAVVGCGYWGSKHVRVLHSIDEVERVVLVDGAQERLSSLSRSYPGAAAFTALTDALPEIDAAVIATPPTTHVPLALEAIAAGKHVLVEKPLAATTAGARELIVAAETAGVILMVGHTFEYNAAVWKLRDLVRSGVLGDLYYLDTARLNLGLYQSDVNVIVDLAPHDFSIINFVVGQSPIAVQAWASRHAHARLEDVAYIRLFYADHRLSANVHVSWLDPYKVRRVTAVGSEKMATYNDLAGDERIRVLDKGVRLPSVEGDLSQRPMSYRYGDILSPYVAFDEPLSIEDRHFAECVRNGTTPATDGRNGLAVVEILDAAQLSLILNRPVMLDELGGRAVLLGASNGYPHDTRPSLDPHEWLRDYFARRENPPAERDRPSEPKRLVR